MYIYIQIAKYNEMKEQLLTIEDVSKRLLISRQSVHRWIRKGKLNPVRFGRLIRFEPDDVEKFIQESKGKPNKAIA